ncbi:glycosyl hydrolase family 28 protein [Vibrio quintilis]|uniref:Exo-poly-alpha-D-galacturonosidase n=1 Tax=Vibrio quintilis TaxID=1117707 RepID=A0A1M7YPZ6_9VIBR|nr:glycoside hydrolase family 28 protein [Vibrio quintilis]SHO54691.1 Exo-poly-alpha-D-galacturonosidase precursor [Vibrio quintilis]
MFKTKAFVFLPGLLTASVMFAVSQNSVAAEQFFGVSPDGTSMRDITPEVPTLAYDDHHVVLTWHKPADYQKIVDYKVYQNGKMIGFASENNQTYSPAVEYIDAFFKADKERFHQHPVYLNFKVNNLMPKTRYQFNLRAVYADDSESSLSKTLSFTTAPAFGKVVNVLDYGAVGDGSTINTQAIQKAIDDCTRSSASAYGCKVVIPASGANKSHPVFVSGALFLKSNMTLEIQKGATLKGSPRAEDYPLSQGYQLYSYRTNPTDSRRPPSLLNALSADHRNGSVNEQVGYDARRHQFENIRVTGGGILDGNGWQHTAKGTADEAGNELTYYIEGNRKKVFSYGILADSQMLAAWREQNSGWKTKDDLYDLIKESYGGFNGQTSKDLYANRRSSLATLRGVSHAYVGELEIRNPAYHTIMFLESDHMTFAYNYVETYDINNADGVEFGNSAHAAVFSNFMNTGDDVVNFAAGQGADYEEGYSDAKPVEKIWIFNNYLREGHGAIAIGSHTGAWIQDLLAEDNVLFLTNYGFRMKSTTATGGGARRVVFRDNAMKDIGTHNRYKMNGVKIKNHGQIGSPFVMTLAYSMGDNVFKDARKPAQFKHIRIINNTLDNVSSKSGAPLIKVDGFDSSKSDSSYPESFHEDVIVSNLKAKHVVATQIDHLKDATFENVAVTDWDSQHKLLWNMTHSENIHFSHVKPAHKDIE